MSVLINLWICFISIVFAQKHKTHKFDHFGFRAPRLIHQHKAHRLPQSAYASRHHKHLAHAAKEIDYDKLLEAQEIAELYDEVENEDDGYDKYADDYFSDMDESAAWIVTQANQLVADRPKRLFRHRAGVDPTFIEVRWPISAADWSSWGLFKWNVYTKQVDLGIMTAEQIKSVYDDNSLRKHTEMELLKWAAVECRVKGWTVVASFTEDCLADLGSETAKSDLDFTFIYWPEPSKVVCTMLKFYAKFYELYGNWPLEVYDMNLYIASGFTKKPCWDSWPGDASTNIIKSLFTALKNNDHDANPDYELGSKKGYKVKILSDKVIPYFKVDNYMAYLWVKRRLDKGTLDEKKGEAKLKTLTKYAVAFYWYLEKIRDGTVHIDTNEEFDKAVVFLKALLYGMNYWSDESYVSNAALQLIYKKAVAKMPEESKFIAVLDCTAFINRYHIDGKAKTNLWFWNKISKYMARNGKLLQTTSVFTKHDTVKTHKKKDFPDDAYKFFRKNHPNPDNFNENELEKCNYFTLADQWSTEWDGSKGTANVGNGKKKIRGDVPLNWIEAGHIGNKKIWNEDYNTWYEAWAKAKKETDPIQKKKILEGCGAGINAGTPAARDIQMLNKLRWNARYLHSNFPAKYRDLAGLFVRGRKIWDHMKTKDRLSNKHTVMKLLNTMVASLETKHIVRIEPVATEIKRIVTQLQKDIEGWVSVSVTETARSPEGVGIPKTKTIKQWLTKGSNKDKSKTWVVMEKLLDNEGGLNYFNNKATAKILEMRKE